MRDRGRLLALFVCTALSSVAYGGTEGAMPVTRSQASRVMNTVVVPAYKENPNIRPLTERLFKALDEHGMRAETELLIVDDNSRDGSEQTVAALQGEGFPVRIIVRTSERGLSSAVLRGFKDGLGSRLICMDGDLQHPPEKVPLMLKELVDGHDFVIGTRYGTGFDVDPSWPWYRVVISKGARLMARPLTPLSDPMSGFFGIARAALERGARDTSPVGFKIGLELYVKCKCETFAEVNIFFAKREHGQSKLTGKVMVYYVLHLLQLYQFRFPFAIPAALVLAALVLWQMVAFCLSGVRGKVGGKDA